MKKICGKTPWQALPATGWFLFFIFIPLCIATLYSFFQRGPYGGVVYTFTLENYTRSFDSVYLGIFFNSLVLATFTTVLCLLLGYPMAYVIAVSNQRVRNILLLLVVIPFLTNLVVRAYALKVLLGIHGPVNNLLLSLGAIHEPVAFTDNNYAVGYGMVTNYLPFMILPLYVTLEKFDFTLLEAARDLGASGKQVFFQVLLPLTKSGIITGLILVFVPALGEFVIPDLFGGAKTMMIGNLITEQFLKTRDWPFGAALSALMMIVVFIILYAQKHWEEAIDE